MDTQTFENIDAAKWARIQALVLSKTGINIAKNEGAATAKGITLGWVYDPAGLTLKTTLVKREWFDPSEKDIDLKMHEIVASA